MFAALLVIVVVLVILYIYNGVKRPKNFPPGPRWLPFVGNHFDITGLARSFGGLHLVFQHLAEKYGSPVVGFKLGKEQIVAVTDYSTVKEILTGDEFEARPDNFFLKIRNFGKRNTGVTASDGPVWHTNRAFIVRHLRNLGFGQKPVEAMIKREVYEMVNFLEDHGSSINISKFFAVKVLNILMTLMSGQTTTKDEKTIDELLNLFSTRGRLFNITGGMLNWYPWLSYIAPEWSGYNLVQELNKKLKGILEEKVQEHYDTWDENRDDDLIYSYISEIKKADKNSVFSHDELIIVCCDFIIAGAQTTSGALELLFSAMISRPEIQKKVQEEIDNNVGEKELQYSDLDKLPYTHAVIMELHRRLTVMPVIGPRRATRDTTVGGYSIPKDTTIMINIHGIHQDRSFWKDPEVFRPERFLGENGNLVNVERVVPFGLGKRRCLGEILAKQCLFYFFVETMRNFKVDLSPECVPMKGKLTLGITLLTEEYRARFSKRSY